MKDEEWYAGLHIFFEFVVITQAHAKHSEMSLVPAISLRRMRLAMIFRNVCHAY